MSNKRDEWAECIHDINNFLAFLSLDIEEISSVSDEKRMEICARAVETIRAVADLASSSLRRIYSEHCLEPLELSKRFKDWLEIKERLMQLYDIELSLTHDITPGCAVYSSQELAQRVALKVIENAVKAGATRLQLHYQEHEHTVVGTFADNGCGMSQKQLIDLGFARTNPDKGVPLLRKIINDAAGRVEWTYREQIGTWVTITIRKVPRDDTR